MKKYRFTQINDMDLWDSIVVHSPQYSVFSSSLYLNSIGKNSCLYFVYKGQQVKAAISLIIGDNEGISELDDLCIYNSILFFDSPDQKFTNLRSEQFEITKFIIEQLEINYKSFSIALSPEFSDIRPFLWHNYHSKKSIDKINVDLRYTSYLDISEFFLKKNDEDTLLFNNLDGKRQSDLKKAIKNNLILSESDDVDLFIKLYDQLLKSQSVEVPKEKLIRMKKLIENLLLNKLAKYFITLNSENKITYATIFTVHNHKGCYLFGAGDRNLMDRYDATYLIWEGMKKLSEVGVFLIDLEGVNSPERGKFKLGFGGDLRPYYQVYKN